jgi:flagellar motor component MotA
MVSGLAFALIAGAYALDHTTDVQVRWLFVVPAALILVGATILAVVVRRMRGPVCVEPPPDIQ